MSLSLPVLWDFKVDHEPDPLFFTAFDLVFELLLDLCLIPARDSAEALASFEDKGLIVS
jgi:hypothetical protein